MTIFCIGINHKTAPVSVREKLTVSHETLAAHFASADFGGVAMVSTCNRLELYFSAAESDDSTRFGDFWSRCCDTDLNLNRFSESTYQLAGADAIRHLLRVSAGLESMVLGEPQILGQVTRAYETAIASQTADPLLKSVFQHAIRSGKRARTETKISRNPVSVSTIGVSLVKRNLKQLGDPADAKILVIGAGEMAQLAVKGLKSFRFHNIMVVNRNVERAQATAARWQVAGAGLDTLDQLLPAADGVISATASADPIILPSQLANRSRPITLVDLAVPRDIDPACGKLPNVQVYDVDALNNEVAEGLAERQKEIPLVEAILAEEMDKYEAWLKESAVHPTLTALRLQAEQIRQKELARTLKYLGDADPDLLKHVEKLSQSLVKQLLHRPTKLLREEARNGTLNGLEESTRKLFDL